MLVMGSSQWPGQHREWVVNGSVPRLGSDVHFGRGAMAQNT